MLANVVSNIKKDLEYPELLPRFRFELVDTKMVKLTIVNKKDMGRAMMVITELEIVSGLVRKGYEVV